MGADCGANSEVHRETWFDGVRAIGITLPEILTLSLHDDVRKAVELKNRSSETRMRNDESPVKCPAC